MTQPGDYVRSDSMPCADCEKKVPETTECNAKGHLVVNKAREEAKRNREVCTQHYPADAFISFLSAPFPSAITYEIAHSVSQFCRNVTTAETDAIALLWNNRGTKKPNKFK